MSVIYINKYSVNWISNSFIKSSYFSTTYCTKPTWLNDTLRQWVSGNSRD